MWFKREKSLKSWLLQRTCVSPLLSPHLLVEVFHQLDCPFWLWILTKSSHPMKVSTRRRRTGRQGCMNKRCAPGGPSQLLLCCQTLPLFFYIHVTLRTPNSHWEGITLFSPSLSHPLTFSPMLTWARWFEEIQIAGLMRQITESKTWVALPRDLIWWRVMAFISLPSVLVGTCEPVTSHTTWPLLRGHVRSLHSFSCSLVRTLEQAPRGLTPTTIFDPPTQ